ncbi:MAG: hypothetical protein ACSHXB_15260 [Sulfitobacter sp.]
MSKQDTVIDFFTNSAPIWPEKFASINEVFQVWARAFDRAQDIQLSDEVRTQARTTMEKLWDTAMCLSARSAADVAAVYIMGQNTHSIDAYSYMETAWRVVNTATGEAVLGQLYGAWLKLRAAVVALDLDDEAGDGIYAIAAGLEAQMATIPATTAKGLAIKVDVFGNNVKANVGRVSLDRDLATLTGQDVRPE